MFTCNPNVDDACFFDEKLELGGQYTELRKHGYARYFQTFFSSTFKPPIDYYGNSIVDVCSLIALNEILPDTGKWLEVPVTDKEYHSLDEKIGSLGIDFEKTVIIHPSITWATRTWPFARWQELTDRLLKNGWQVMAVGSTKPVIERRNQLEAISMHSCPKGAIDCVDLFSVLETIALLNKCKAVVTMDSGLLHMALCTPIHIVGMFTITAPQFRLAWRGNGFYHRFASILPKGTCCYCSSDKTNPVKDFKTCPKGKTPPCMPDAETVYAAFRNLMETVNHSHPIQQRRLSMQPTTINPDMVCQQAMQVKLNVYQAKEHFETVLKTYNDQLDSLINLVNLMKHRILELEGELEREHSKGKPAKKPEETKA